MIKLAHLSDIHLSPLPEVRLSELMSKRITGYLNWKLNRRGVMQDGILEGLIADLKQRNPDHIAVTGDLVNLALHKEFEASLAWLENLGPPNDVSVIPGNHDAYVPGALNQALTMWRPYVSGDHLQESTQFPYLRRRGEISIIATNSGKSSAPFLATGHFDPAQEKTTKKVLIEEKQAGRFCVVLIHHPPFEGATSWAKRLIGAERFRKVIRECGADLVLHGHTHIDSYAEIDGPEGPVPVIGVPSASKGLSVDADSHSKPASRYNLFEIDKSANGWSCDWSEFGYSSLEKGVHQISEQNLWSDGVLAVR